MNTFLVTRISEDANVITRSSAFFDVDGQCISNLNGQLASDAVDACVVFLNEADNMLVGWYRNATLYAEPQYHLQSQRKYQVRCKVEDAYLLAESNRHTLPKSLSELDELQKAARFTPLSLSTSDHSAIEVDAKKLTEQYYDTGDATLLPYIYHSALKWSADSPEDAAPFDYLGFTLLELARPQEALAEFEKALHIDPLYKSSVRDKGECLIRLGRFDEAISWLNSALDGLPVDEIRLQLSDAYLIAGFPGISYRILKTLQTDEARELAEPFIKERERSMPYLLSSKPEYSVPDAYPLFMDFKSEALPELYTDAYGTTRYLDPIRNKSVPITPEETVRQRVIAYLMKRTRVPKQSILVEESLTHIDRELRDRVDILVAAIDKGKRRHVLLVECKAPGIVLEGEPTAQLLRYNRVLNAPFAMLTNGDETQLYHFSSESGEFTALRELPSYTEMCQSVNIKPARLQQSKWVRPEYDALSQTKVTDEYVLHGLLGEGSPDALKPFMLNLAFCLLDETHKIECPLKVPGCAIETDYGVVPKTTGNAGGGSFSGNYRWLGVRDRHGRRQNVYIAVFGIGNTDKVDLADFKTEATTLYFAVEEKGHAVSRLQIRLDSCLIPEGGGYRLTHTGVRSRGKIQPLIDYISSTVPELLGRSERILCGHLDGTKNLCLSDADTAQTIARSVSYLLLRSELREMEKTTGGDKKNVFN